MFHYLETFFSLAETLSYTETARRLNIAQSAVSRQIKILEEQLGLQLFIRTTQSVHLSAGGQDLLVKLKPLFNEIRLSIDEVQTNKNELKGLIRIGSSFEAGKHILMPKLLEFKERHPGLVFELNLESSQSVREKIQSGEYDFGFVSQSSNITGARSYPFTKDRPVMIAAKQGPLRSLEISESVEIVHYRKIDPFVEAFLQRNFDRKSRQNFRLGFVVNSHEAMADVLQRRPSVAVIPKTSFSVLKQTHALQILKEGKDSYPLNILTPDHPIREKRKKMFLEFLLREAKKNSLSL